MALRHLRRAHRFHVPHFRVVSPHTGGGVLPQWDAVFESIYNGSAAASYREASHRTRLGRHRHSACYTALGDRIRVHQRAGDMGHTAPSPLWRVKQRLFTAMSVLCSRKTW